MEAFEGIWKSIEKKILNSQPEKQKKKNLLAFPTAVSLRIIQKKKRENAHKKKKICVLLKEIEMKQNFHVH